MGQYDTNLQQIVGTDKVEVFVDDLTEYGPYPSLDPEVEGDAPWIFYDLGGENLPYTLMGVLEYYFRNKRAVKITVEDAGEARGPRIAAETIETIRNQRQRALVALEAEARMRDRQRHQPKY